MLLARCWRGVRRRSGVRPGRLVARRQAQPRGKPSGPPVPVARFTDVAKQAGLTQPSSTARPTPRTTSSRSSAAASRFFDYDNDGWLDLLRAERHAARRRPAGHDQSPVQEQSRRHVHRRHREGGLDAIRLGVGCDRRRLRQRRLRRSLHHLLRPERPVSQQRRRHVHRRHREGGSAPGRMSGTAPAAPGSTTIATAVSTSSSPTT